VPGTSPAGVPLAPPRWTPWRRLLRGARRLAVWHPLPVPASHALGRRGEEIAYWSLREHGYTIVARNHRRAPGQAGRGEIDLIAFAGSPPVLVFIEVKTRAREGIAPAEWAADAAQRRALFATARAYRRRRGYTGPWRFDMVVIYGPADANPRIFLHRNALRDPAAPRP
jgi:Holliday junction resolvase-like predicted endonuclease